MIGTFGKPSKWRADLFELIINVTEKLVVPYQSKYNWKFKFG